MQGAPHCHAKSCMYSPGWCRSRVRDDMRGIGCTPASILGNIAAATRTPFFQVAELARWVCVSPDKHVLRRRLPALAVPTHYRLCRALITRQDSNSTTRLLQGVFMWSCTLVRRLGHPACAHALKEAEWGRVVQLRCAGSALLRNKLILQV